MPDWIETTTGNRISTSANIFGSNKILINGNTTINTKVLLKGDIDLFDEKQVSSIQIGKYCYLDTSCQIIPPVLKDDLCSHIKIGAYTIIGKNTIVKSTSIGSRVLVEPNCLLENLSIVYDCCLIKEGTVIPPKMVIPPFSEVSGKPGVDFKIKELHNSYKRLIEYEAKQLQILG